VLWRDASSIVCLGEGMSANGQMGGPGSFSSLERGLGRAMRIPVFLDAALPRFWMCRTRRTLGSPVRLMRPSTSGWREASSTTIASHPSIV
jgi:hypothetical protein